MKKEFIDVIILLDQSISMIELTDDTIGGFNSLIETQKKENENKDVFVTTYLFNTEIKTLCDSKRISQIKPLTRQEYVASGSTALFDAIGYAIKREENKVRRLKRNHKAITSKTLYVITTDGYENSSRKYRTLDSIRDLIKKKKKEGACFVFIGADIDSDEFAEKLGIGSDYAFNVNRSSIGIRDMMDNVSCCMIDLNTPNFDEKIRNRSFLRRNMINNSHTNKRT